MAVNTGRVIVGGIAAGVAANVCDYVIFNVLMKDQMAAEMNALNPALAAKAAAMPGMIGAIVLDFVIGFVMVWIYASARATYGPGPKTAMRVGLAMWILFAAIYASFTAMGMYSWNFFYMGSAFAIVSTMLAALTGGAVYKE